MEERLSRQIQSAQAIKNESYLQNQREIIRAEERIKFERQYIEQANAADEKCRQLRDELAQKERRLHDDLRVRSDDIDRINYNQRQHLLKELQRIQEKESELYKTQSELNKLGCTIFWFLNSGNSPSIIHQKSFPKTSNNSFKSFIGISP